MATTRQEQQLRLLDELDPDARAQAWLAGDDDSSEPAWGADPMQLAEDLEERIGHGLNYDQPIN